MLGLFKRSKRTDTKMSEVKNIDAATLKDWMDKDEVILIDVREIGEYTEGYIPGAVLFPVAGCCPEVLPKNPDKKIVFYCRAGVRGGKACQTCACNDCQPVIYNLDGGIIAWANAGYELTRA